MPHLIDELTPEETKKIERIDAYYRPLLNASMSRVKIAMKNGEKERQTMTKS